MKSDSDYCGFACGFALDQVQQALNEIKDFSKYNPETAMVVLGKVMELVYNTRFELAPMKTDAA